MRDRISELSKKIAEQHHQDVVEELKVVDWCQYGIVDLIWFTEKPGQSTTVLTCEEHGHTPNLEEA